MNTTEQLMQQFNGKKLVTAEERKEAGLFSRLRPATIETYAMRGKLGIPCVKFYKRDKPMFNIDDIARFLESQKQNA